MGVMAMAMVMDIMAILIAMAIITTVMIVPMETIATGMIVMMVQGVDPVIGDEIKGQGNNL
ncbi:MAG: hypothetical protein A2157_11795 [Deltaproteobacteria bacterium RBG_16_47_11]|nr:MAG: hypothetical protein A2157_11795 [Deltaproteobacteria bacterium RBG_16_47_11]